MDYIDILKSRYIYNNGGNVMDYLKRNYGNQYNISKYIEISYDLQAGSYIKNFNQNKDEKIKYIKEASNFISSHIDSNDYILNVGAGELWTISLINDHLNKSAGCIYNLEISWSRLFKGIDFWNEWNKKNTNMVPMIADMLQIPLPSKSIDIVTSSHGLEPNGSKLKCIIKELFRVTRKKCVLFEPSYDHATPEGQLRMDKLGYIKNIEETAKDLGGSVLDVQLLKNSSNPLNPTACFVLEPPSSETPVNLHSNHFTVPGTDLPLEKKEQFYISRNTGLVFPVLGSVPILKHEHAILATAFTE